MLQYFFISAALLAVVVLTLTHIPLWLLWIVMRFIPVWVQALAIHAFGYVVGGVTGHLARALMSVPYYYVVRYWIRPRVVVPRSIVHGP